MRAHGQHHPSQGAREPLLRACILAVLAPIAAGSRSALPCSQEDRRPWGLSRPRCGASLRPRWLPGAVGDKEQGWGQAGRAREGGLPCSDLSGNREGPIHMRRPWGLGTHAPAAPGLSLPGCNRATMQAPGPADVGACGVQGPAPLSAWARIQQWPQLQDPQGKQPGKGHLRWAGTLGASGLGTSFLDGANSVSVPLHAQTPKPAEAARWSAG